MSAYITFEQQLVRMNERLAAAGSGIRLQHAVQVVDETGTVERVFPVTPTSEVAKDLNAYVDSIINQDTFHM